jgi:hypothetical protein
MPDIAMVPFVVAILSGVFITYWIFIAVYLYSNGVAVVYFQNTFFTLPTQKQVIFWIHIFSLLWMIQFGQAFVTMCIAGAVGSWYWKRHKKLIDPRGFFVFHSVKRTILYHLGKINHKTRDNCLWFFNSSNNRVHKVII